MSSHQSPMKSVAVMETDSDDTKIVIKKMEKALADFRAGKFVMVMDSADRENECDLIIAAEHCTKEQMAFMIRHSTGIVCVATNKDRLEHFGLHPATGDNTDRNATNFYVSTDYLVGTSTGVSAADRVATLRAMCDMNNPPETFSKPGHMFPLMANANGVLGRPGHTESTYEFCVLSQCAHPVGALAEMMHPDGEMYRAEDSIAFAKEHGFEMVYVTDIIAYRKILESRRVQKFPALQEGGEASAAVAKAHIRLKGLSADCRILVPRPSETGSETIIVVKGEVKGREDVPVRMHSECFTGDTLGSMLCDCGEQLAKFIHVLDKSEFGILVYIKGHEGRGIGLYNKIQTYALQQEECIDTMDANTALGFDVDSRSFDDAIRGIRELEPKSLIIYSNNPEKEAELKKFFPARKAPLATVPTEYNRKYMETKVARAGHTTCIESFDVSPPSLIDENITVAIVSTAWNETYVNTMREEAIAHLKKSGVGNIIEKQVAGVMDLVAATKVCCKRYRPDAVICLGILVEGASDTYQHQCSAITQGLMQLQLDVDSAIVQGILMCKDETQIIERVGMKRNPGRAYAMSALSLIDLNR